MTPALSPIPSFASFISIRDASATTKRGQTTVSGQRKKGRWVISDDTTHKVQIQVESSVNDR